MYSENETRSSDRILVLKVITGLKAKSSTGLTDPRLFSGENNCHVIQDDSSIWSFKYDVGGLPEPLKCKFTTFNKALEHARQYYLRRNVEIVEVID